jgi:lipid II:glycine glycyltransferase (peptidoglycan interpeptide bridge formation enzyme)
MNLFIKINNAIDKNTWKNFVSNHFSGNIFQTPEMYDFFSTVDNYQPLAIACLDEHEKIQGVLLAVIEREHQGFIGKFSSRGIVWGGPLLDESAEENTLQLILNALIKELGTKTIYLEFRNLFDFADKIDVFKANGFTYKEHLNFRVPTTVGDDPQKKLSSNRKRQIKKSLASGASIDVAVSIEEVEEFYRILFALYKNRVRKPLPDYSFFKNFFLNKEKFGIYLLVKFNGKVIGGIMCPIFRDKAIYEWYVCGLDEEYPEQYPSVLATWAAIEYAHKNGIHFFDFMGAGSPDQDYGVREFKARFGGDMVNFGRFTRINNKTLYNLGKFGLKVLGKIKKI